MVNLCHIALDAVVQRLKPGDIIGTAGNPWNPVSQAIRVAQGDCRWTHVCIVGDDGWIWTTDASFSLLRGGWLYGDVDAYDYLGKQRAFIVMRYKDLGFDEFSKIEARCIDRHGSRYPLGEVLAMATRRVLGFGQPSSGVDNFLEFCSENVVKTYTEAGLTLTRKTGPLQPTGWTPEDVLNAAELEYVMTR